MNNDITPPRPPKQPTEPNQTQTEADIQPQQTPTPPSVAPQPITEPSLKPRISLKRKLLFTGIGVLIGLIIAAVGVWFWYSQQLGAVAPGSDEKVKLTIEVGSNPAQIASLLKENDVIKNQTAFEWYVRSNGKAGLLQTGAYRLSKSDNVPKIVEHLTSGKTDTFSITFLPGATLAKHRQVVIDAGYGEQQVDAALQKTYDHPLFVGKPDGADLEGYIYGETYAFAADATPEQILERTFDQFEMVVEQEKLVALYEKQGFSLFQGITLASIIQREVATPTDAAQVAQVFKLRLDTGMMLGSDVTYQYIADKTGQTRSVDLDSPYNTRRYTGLTPGPIASPGLDALKAVGSPAAGDFVYFLSGDDDKTYFAKTNEEHERNIRERCQKKCQII